METRAPLGLERSIPQRDVRKLIWRYLNEYDRELVRCAQNSQRVPQLGRDFVLNCAERGYVELLQWAREHHGVADLVPSDWTVRRAALGGRIAVLQWLLANGVQLHETACNCAAYGGRTETLSWLRANGVPWNEWTCTCATDGGQLECLKWLRSNGAPWDRSALRFALYHNRTEMIEWLKANGAPE